MKKLAAEKYRDIEFSRAKRGPVVKPEPGRMKISIRIDNTVFELDAVRQVVREELAAYGSAQGAGHRLRRTCAARR